MGCFYANVRGSQVEDGNRIMGFEIPSGEAVTHRERPGIVAPTGTETRVLLDWGIDHTALVISPAGNRSIVRSDSSIDPHRDTL
jgi:hypothetical protein